MNFSELREDVRRKYASCILKTSRAERPAISERFRTHECVLKLLATSKLSDRLHPTIVQMMDELTDDWQPEQVAVAFEAMETYAVNLLEYPWKTEFHTILLYSGFYKTRLEPHIQEPHILLGIIGYERVPDDRLFLIKGVPSQEILIDAAVNFFLAATECRVIASVVSKVEHSTPIEVYWMRRANVGDEQVCIDTLTLSRRPLPPDSEKPLTFETVDVEPQVKKFNTEAKKRAGSPYDNVQSAADYSKPQYGILMQPSSTQSSSILRSPLEGISTEAQLPDPFVPAFSAFRQLPNVAGQVAKSSPGTNVGATFQPETPPPVYAAARHMPSARLQNVAYGPDDEVDALAALLKDIDPQLMENAVHRQQIMSQLENYPSADHTSSLKTDLPPRHVGRHVRHASPAADTVRTGWQCLHCTYYNDNSAHLCEMCNHEKA